MLTCKYRIEVLYLFQTWKIALHRKWLKLNLNSWMYVVLEVGCFQHRWGNSDHWRSSVKSYHPIVWSRLSRLLSYQVSEITVTNKTLLQPHSKQHEQITPTCQSQHTRTVNDRDTHTQTLGARTHWGGVTYTSPDIPELKRLWTVSKETNM